MCASFLNPNVPKSYEEIMKVKKIILLDRSDIMRYPKTNQFGFERGYL